MTIPAARGAGAVSARRAGFGCESAAIMGPFLELGYLNRVRTQCKEIPCSIAHRSAPPKIKRRKTGRQECLPHRGFQQSRSNRDRAEFLNGRPGKQRLVVSRSISSLSLSLSRARRVRRAQMLRLESPSPLPPPRPSGGNSGHYKSRSVARGSSTACAGSSRAGR